MAVQAIEKGSKVANYVHAKRPLDILFRHGDIHLSTYAATS